jgi:hypothetical protein
LQGVEEATPPGATMPTQNLPSIVRKDNNILSAANSDLPHYNYGYSTKQHV